MSGFLYTKNKKNDFFQMGGCNMNENRAGLGYQDFEEVRTPHKYGLQLCIMCVMISVEIAKLY